MTNKSLNLPLFSEALLAWYDTQGRKTLPWRQSITPYRVWVSEVMLQQTQVKTAIPYFERFMARFPTLEDLASAHEDEVLHLWTGLGYYARGRNLHRAAMLILSDHGGVFPNTLPSLLSLPGIGRSTAGAILSIAFDQKAPILDGNVRRILARVHMLNGVITDKLFLERLWEIAEGYTPTKRPGDYAQAIMDLGAMLCAKSKPFCERCPVSFECQAYLQNRQSEFPIARQQKKKAVRCIYMLIVRDKKQNRVLLEKRPSVGIWGGLWSFPECPIDQDIMEWCTKQLSIQVLSLEKLPVLKHTFTHFVLNINPIYIDQYHYLNHIADEGAKIWYSLNDPVDLGLASPIKQLLQEVCQ